MSDLGYRPCLADLDLWIKAEIRPDGGVEYYSYILCYVDDILVIHHDSTAPVKEKIWTTLGAEFGEDAGSKAIVVRSLYGLKSSGAAFRDLLGECMSDLGYHPCLADPDL